MSVLHHFIAFLKYLKPKGLGNVSENLVSEGLGRARSSEVSCIFSRLLSEVERHMGPEQSDSIKESPK